MPITAQILKGDPYITFTIPVVEKLEGNRPQYEVVKLAERRWRLQGAARTTFVLKKEKDNE